MAASEAIMIGNHPLSGKLMGAEYRVTRLGGWWTRPNVKRAELSRELGDGDFPQPWHFEARYISIDGYVDCQDHGQMHHIMDQLNGLAVTRREYLSVQGHGQLQSSLVEADGGGMVEPVTDKLLRFELRFKANDPRKYGEMHTADVSTTWSRLRQFGNYPAYPSFRLSSSDIDDNGFQIFGDYPDGEQRVWWYNYFSDNATHEVDFRTGKHLVGGVARPGRIRRSETFMIPPHNYVRNLVRPQTSSTAGSMIGTVSWRDTWI